MLDEQELFDKKDWKNDILKIEMYMRMRHKGPAAVHACLLFKDKLNKMYYFISNLVSAFLAGIFSILDQFVDICLYLTVVLFI